MAKWLHALAQKLNQAVPKVPRDLIKTRSLSDLAPTNSLCKTACTKMEAKSNENFISSLLVRPLEAHRVVSPGFIRNPQAVLLLAACPTPKSDRLLAVPFQRAAR